jgi:hypothetical protein
MRTTLTMAGLTALLSLPLIAGAVSASPVTVEFLNPEKFTDVQDQRMRLDVERNTNLKGVRQYLEREAPAFLTPGQTLSVQFTDIDLAGDTEPGADLQWRDVRIVSRVYPPRLTFSYSLRDAQGSELKSGEVKLRDLGFLDGTTRRQSDALAYEKRMLDSWMRTELGQ